MGKKLFIILAFLVLFSITSTILEANSSKGITGNAVSSSNLELEIPLEYQHALPGQTIWFTVKLFNLGNTKRSDVILRYSLFNETKDLITTRSETVAVETQASFIGSLNLPENINIGNYELRAEMESDGNSSSVGSSYIEVINIKQDSMFSNRFYLILSIICLIVLLFFLRSWLSSLKNKISRRAKIRKMINYKLREGKISKEELQNSRLKSNPRRLNSNDERIF